jgi:aarF domain-containing kinase
MHELWEEQHECAAGQIFEVFSDLKGFYLKLGQILATKTDMLPAPYTSSLSRLLDKLPPMPFKRVSHYGYAHE